VKRRLAITWSSLVAIPVGLIVLAGYFTASGEGSNLGALRDYLLQTAVVLAGVALIVGVLNLLTAHWRRLRTKPQSALYSGVLLAALLATFILGTIDYSLGLLGDTQRSWSFFLFNFIQVPVESSLMAILAVALAYAGIRMLRQRPTAFTVLFLATFLIVLLGSGVEIPYVTDWIRPWLLQVPVLAGTRGLLLGIGLGAIGAGLRVLTGSDHPYGG
jgi:hypothetical protein